MLEPPELPYKKVGSGKVREIYDLGPNLLIVASDRLSAFDVILSRGVPGKGILLTQLSLWWFQQTKSVMQNHLAADHDRQLEEVIGKYPDLLPRSMLVRKLTPLKLEAVVRGYLAGSGWSEYKKTGKLWDHELPAGLLESSALPQPLFTPTTKAETGHDMPVTANEAKEIVGADVFDAAREATLKLYDLGAQKATQSGLILADTKFEFGTDASGDLYLIDEVLTPDSSRYWPQEGYAPGKPQPAFDKQYVRDYLETLDWDKTHPGPELPTSVITNTQKKYIEALEYLMK
ncbi:phosphoribosylaminoimidazolesuccinocarboxamide synthase [Rubellicoccus peritrichatus]